MTVMQEQSQQQEIAPHATNMPERQTSTSSSSPGPLPQTVTQSSQEPSPGSQGPETQRPDEAASMPTIELPLDLSPTVSLTRDRGLDEINNERNFREVSKEMERIFRDA